ncbi:MAG: rhodanese-like domain-containing protein [Deltaproteobacteria bacterium]|nr:rhodanese-like domain-containing protein [Deltaproteobacteria bacterium]
MKQVIIDVREKDEFKADRVAGSINVPLSELGHQAPGILKNLDGCSFVLMCRSGKRAGLAKQQLEQLGLGCDLQVYEGGILEWKRQGKPTECAGPVAFPIMRQVQLVAGTLVLAGAALTWWVDPRWLALPAFVGLGLTVAGSTGFCGMAELLARMPWNKAAPKGGACGNAC